MKAIFSIIAQSQAVFREKLEFAETQGGLSLEQYVRYLSMQYHLTCNVQKHFFAIASHSSLVNKPKLREFLIAFGLEEELHYRIAQKDLEHLDQKLLPAPLDVKLWWSYFNSIIDSQPFIRLGATCILENLGSGGSDIVKRLLLNVPFITDRTSRFIQIHLHEELPHGDHVIAALQKADLYPEMLNDLKEGAETGAILYLRMLDWVLGTDPLANTISERSSQFDEHERCLCP